MPNYLQGNSYTALQYGPQVTKTALANATSATTWNLFTVSSGNVLVTNLIGVVTTPATAAATMSIGVTTTNKTLATALALATTVTTSHTVGAAFALQPAVNNTVSTVNSGTSVTSYLYNGYQGVVGSPGVNAIVPTGTIMATAGGAMGGNITWYLTYVPLDFGAYVS